MVSKSVVSKSVVSVSVVSVSVVSRSVGQCVTEFQYPARVAAAAAIVLTEPGHAGATYELAGSEALTQTEVASVLSKVLGRPVRAEQIPLADWTLQAQTAGLDTYQIETLVKMFRYYEQHDFRGNPRVLGWLLKRPPRQFRAFVENLITRL